MNTYTRDFNDLSVGTWIDSTTGQGYSGPKRNPNDIAADPITGAALPTTPTVNQTAQIGSVIPAGSTQTGTQTPNIDLTQFQTEDPIRKFNLALLDMLKRAQAGETQMGQEQAQLRREAYRSGQEVFTGEEALMTPSAKMATLQRNVEMFEPSIAAATTKINQLRDITNLMKTTYGEDFSKILPVTPEDAEVFRQALRAGMTIPADMLQRYGKFFTTDDWASWTKINKIKEITQPTSYTEWQLAGSPGTYAEWVKKGAGINLPATQVTMLSDARYFPALLDELENTINKNASLIGPISGQIPFSEAREKVKDDLKRAAQLIGKFMEGGVLRKEDEIKYREMLPQLTDLNSKVALDKLAGVRRMLQEKYNNYLQDFAGSGYNVSGFESIDFGIKGNEQQIDLREQVISIGYDYDAMKNQGYSDEEIKQSLGL